jgi:hypothetical protein
VTGSIGPHGRLTARPALSSLSVRCRRACLHSRTPTRRPHGAPRRARRLRCHARCARPPRPSESRSARQVSRRLSPELLAHRSVAQSPGQTTPRLWRTRATQRIASAGGGHQTCLSWPCAAGIGPDGRRPALRSPGADRSPIRPESSHSSVFRGSTGWGNDDYMSQWRWRDKDARPRQSVHRLQQFAALVMQSCT